MRRPNLGIVFASFLAGPLFLASTACAAAYAEIPHPIPVHVDPSVLASAISLLMAVSAIGFFLAVLPNAVAAAMLTQLGERFEPARSWLFWAGTGAALGLAIALLTRTRGEPLTALGFGFIATSALSACVCRSGARWD